MKKEDFHQKAAAGFDLPVDLIDGVPRITMTGNTVVLVENFKSICGFDREEIRLRCIDGEVVIAGCNLKLLFLKSQELEAEGTIRSVSFIKEDKS